MQGEYHIRGTRISKGVRERKKGEEGNLDGPDRAHGLGVDDDFRERVRLREVLKLIDGLVRHRRIEGDRQETVAKPGKTTLRGISRESWQKHGRE